MASSSRFSCQFHPDSFCYVFGCYVGTSKTNETKHVIVYGTKLCIAYEAYFGMPLGDMDKAWAPHSCCGSCRSTLEGWLHGSHKSMPFAIPRIWREPQNHLNDCYFCAVDKAIRFQTIKKRKTYQYPDLPSSIAPVAHSSQYPVPNAPGISIKDEDEGSSSESDYDLSDDDTSPHFPNQSDMDDLVRDLDLSKTSAEVLISRLKDWKLLDKSCKGSSYRLRHEQFSKFYKLEDQLVFCNDIPNLFKEIGVEHKPDEWRLFIDSSIRSLKAVLLHNGNQYPSIPIAHSVHLKETYENVQSLLNKVGYTKYMWPVCGDFKM